MGKTIVSIPYVTWRDGRPRFIPGPRLRKLGFKGEDLRHPDGSWFGFEQAQAWAAEREKLIRELEARKPRARRAALSRDILTLGQLYEAWMATPRMHGQEVVEGRKRRPALAPNTVRYYRQAAACLEKFDEGRLWLASAAAVTPRTLLGVSPSGAETGVLHRIEVDHGLAIARCVRAMLSALYSWGVSARKVPRNPVAEIEVELPELSPRIRYGSIAEMKALIAAADAIGRADIGDAIVLGLWTGQRQGDRLALTDGQDTAEGILFRQHKKHGQPLLIRQAPELAARLAAARARRAGWRVNYPHVLLDEAPGRRRPWDEHWYRKKFREVRAAAVAGVPDGQGGWLVEPCPSLADFRDQDLRDTAVTWLALAGVDKLGIASITGHSLGSIDEILKHYLGYHPELARSAIARLVDWYEGAENR